MSTRYVWLLALCLSANSAPAAIKTQDLLRPTDVEDVRLSPSGKRLAFLMKGQKSENDFVVLEQRDSGFTPVFVTHLPSNQGFKSFRWLADDYLALSFSTSDETLDQLSIANIPKKSVTVLEPAANVIKPRWGDDDHVLISTSFSCSVAQSVSDGRCLTSLNLRNSGRNVVAPFVRLLPVVFTAYSESDIYVRGWDADRKEHAMKFDPTGGQWKEMEISALTEVQEARRVSPQARVRSAGAAFSAGSMPVGLEDRPPIGYNSPPPKRGFTSLSPDFDLLEVALETGFNGKHAILSQVSDDLKRGLVLIDGEDIPTQCVLWDRDRGLINLDIFRSKLDGEALAETRIERSWIEGAALAITAPPKTIPVKGVVVVPIPSLRAAMDQQPGVFNGEAQAFALNGLVYVRMPLEMQNRFANGNGAEAWRARAHQAIQTVIDKAAAEFAASPNAEAPVCLLGENYMGSLLFSSDSFNRVRCAAALNAPLLPDHLAERIQLSEHAYMKLSNAVLERQVRGVFELPGGGFLEPADRVRGLPDKIMLAYELTRPLNEVFGRNSNAFRSAAKKAGKSLTYDASLSDRDDESAYHARTIDSIIGFMSASLAAKN